MNIVNRSDPKQIYSAESNLEEAIILHFVLFQIITWFRDWFKNKLFLPHSNLKYLWYLSHYVGIQTAALLVTLWISYGHTVHIQRADWSFEFQLSIYIAVIWIFRTVAGSKNWISSKESLRISSHPILITLVKSNNYN